MITYRCCDCGSENVIEIRPSIDTPTALVGSRHPETSKEAARRALPNSPILRRKIFDAIKERPRTDDELEVLLDSPHQSVSSQRRGLVLDGWVEDSGRRRKTRSDRWAIVWRVRRRVVRRPR